MDTQNIYLLYSCDEWKSFASMRLQMATTKSTVLDNAIAAFIRDGDMTFNGEDGRVAADEFLVENKARRLRNAGSNCLYKLVSRRLS